MHCTRRAWLAQTAAGVGSFYFGRRGFAAGAAPGGKVSVTKCRSYGPELVPVMARMFDQIGGLGRIVKGKTVAVKVNLTGTPDTRLGYKALEDTHFTHYRVIGAAVHLMGRAGARRIRILESCWSTAEPVEEFMLQANWDPQVIVGAAPRVEFENTNYLGPNAKEYARFTVPGGGHMFKAYDLNHSYRDCDVFVSIAKLKDHATTGVTLSMKNCFGITPCTIYGEGAEKDEPSIEPRGGRLMLHTGYRQPSKSAPQENDPRSPREGGYRVPRVVADLAAARRIDLAIVEGIESMAGGEGPWIAGARPVSPGVIVAGTNPVATDAVSMAVMGYDPMADRGAAPFEHCDSTLRLAEELGVGTRDLKRIEVAGTPIKQALFDYAALRRLHPLPKG